MNIALNLNKRKQGKKYEQKAAEFLKAKNYQIISSNYQAGKFEIDLIALDKETLVFIEVKYRNNQTDYHNPFASIPSTKQKRIFIAAQTYLQQHPHYRHLSSRFDAIFILSRTHSIGNIIQNTSKIQTENQKKIVHLKNIFN